MMLALIIQPDCLEKYGNIPEPPEKSDSTAKVIRYDFEDALLVNEDFSDPINKTCGTLLALGDIDYFNAEKCILVREWLLNRLKSDCPQKLKKIYEDMLTFCDEAISLGTGVVVEL